MRRKPPLAWSKIKDKVKRDIEPLGYNFEAVVSFKEYSDKRDLLFIYL